jgi:hypothetical protein
LIVADVIEAVQPRGVVLLHIRHEGHGKSIGQAPILKEPLRVRDPNKEKAVLHDWNSKSLLVTIDSRPPQTVKKQTVGLMGSYQR